MEKDKEFYIKEFKERFKACYNIASELNAKQFCQALYCCLSSQRGKYKVFCEDCPFVDCCIMNESPDTMTSIFGKYKYLPDEVDTKNAIEKKENNNVDN